MRDLMAYLKEVMKDYRNEVQGKKLVAWKGRFFYMNLTGSIRLDIVSDTRIFLEIYLFWLCTVAFCCKEIGMYFTVNT